MEAFFYNALQTAINTDNAIKSTETASINLIRVFIYIDLRLLIALAIVPYYYSLMKYELLSK